MDVRLWNDRKGLESRLRPRAAAWWLTNERIDERMTTRWQWPLLGAVSAALFSAIVFYQLPVEIYGGNADQFEWPLPNLLSVYFPWPVLALIAAPILLALLPARPSRWIASLLAIVAVVTWLNGTFFLYNFGLLDGQHWKIEAPVWRIALELGSALVAAAIVWTAAGSRAGTLTAFLAVLTAAAIVPVLTISSDKAPPVAQDTALLSSFSPEKNMLIVLLDGMQSDVFEDVVAANTDIAASLDGFTHYPDTAGVAMTTYLTVPAIHSGIEYRPGMSIKSWYQDGVVNGSFLNLLTDAGYSSVMINPMMNVCPAKANSCSRIVSLFNGQESGRRQEASELANIALLRVAPFPLKSLVYNGGKWLLDFDKPDPRTVHKAVEGISFLDYVSKHLTVDSAKPTVKYYHLLSTHMPVVLDQSCRFVGESKNTRAKYLFQARCAMKAFAVLLDALKAKGIYDKTAIILVADHGSGGWPNPRFMEDRGIVSGMRTVANPTLAIKPFGATGPMAASTRPVSILSVAPTICGLTGDCKAFPELSLTQEAPSQNAVRHFNSYKWKPDYWTKDILPEVTVYEIKGPVQKSASWTKLPPH